MGSRTRSASEDEETQSNADFTDAADVAERGFIPSVGPSPAFHPRNSGDMDLVSPLVSPLPVPMDTVEVLPEDDEAFVLPQASIDASGHSGLAQSRMLQNLL